MVTMIRIGFVTRLVTAVLLSLLTMTVLVTHLRMCRAIQFTSMTKHGLRANTLARRAASMVASFVSKGEAEGFVSPNER